MPQRTRKRPSTYRYYSSGSSGPRPGFTNPTFREWMSDNFSTPNQENFCSHATNIRRASGKLYTMSGVSENVSGYCDSEKASTIVSSLFPDAIMVAVPQLSFQENNDFNLFNLLFEMDDVIKLFSLRFWRDLSYGSVNWGLLPFYSDLRSLVNSYRDLKDQMFSSELSNSQERKVERRSKYVRSGLSGDTYFEFEGDLIVNGSFFLELPAGVSSAELSLRIFADELGIHPDLSTVWDLIPFSFILDYYLPIGDLIDEIHPQGWFSPRWRFSGTISLLGELRYSFGFNPSLGRGPLATDRVYERRVRQTLNNLTYGQPASRWQAPSFKEVFNTAYVSLSRRKGKPSRLA